MEENNQNQESQNIENTNTEPSAIEQEAMSMGWNPDKFKDDPDKYIDAKEFVRRKPLFDKIDSLSKRQKQTEQTLRDLAAHHQRVKEVEYQRALKTLRDEKRAALKEGDTVAALELEDRMEEMFTSHQEEVAELHRQQAMEQQRQQSGPTPEFQSWVRDNAWYLQDAEMHDFADGTAAAFIARAQANGTQLTEQEVFQYVKDKVKKAYPDKFENPNRQRPSTVGSGDKNQGKPTKGYTLSAEEEQVARNFERQGIMTRAEYIKELEKTNG